MPQFQDQLEEKLNRLHRDVATLFEVAGLRRDQAQLAAGAGTPPPRVLGFTLLGLDGRFVIDLVNPATATGPFTNLVQSGVAKSVAHAKRLRGPAARNLNSGAQLDRGTPQAVFHQLQSSTTSDFDVVGDVQSYGPEAKTHWVIEDPNSTRYWRVRSKYQSSEYNEWLYYEDPSVCGVRAIWAGVVRNKATSSLNQAYSRNGGSPLTQLGVTTEIDVAAAVWKSGDGFVGTPRDVSYNSGFVDPGILGTYYIYARDPKLAGGTVTFIATLNVEDINSYDDVMYFGKITTVGGGGGTGSGGGAGPCVIEGVMVTRPDGSEAVAETFRKGDQVRNTEGGVDTLTADPEITGNVPCFRFTLANGLVLKGCSSRHSLLFADGGMDFAFDLRVGDVLWTRLGPSAITAKEFIGHRTVYKFHLDNVRTYITDGVGSHNVNGSLK